MLTTTRTHNSPVVDKAIELLRPDDVIRVGGAGFKVLLVISGNTPYQIYFHVLKIIFYQFDFF
jgi:3'(2'), 5'-bisphosphate nucleotidase